MVGQLSLGVECTVLHSLLGISTHLRMANKKSLSLNNARRTSRIQFVAFSKIRNRLRFDALGI